MNVLVDIEVANFDWFESYERKAVKLMQHFDGTLVFAFEVNRHANGTGREIHLLSFPSEDQFNAYRNCDAIKALAEERHRAIISTEVIILNKRKEYNLY